MLTVRLFHRVAAALPKQLLLYVTLYVCGIAVELTVTVNRNQNSLLLLHECLIYGRNGQVGSLLSYLM